MISVCCKLLKLHSCDPFILFPILRGPFFMQGRSVQNVSPKDKCYYKILGIATGASLDEIKDAYYKLSKVHHPDMHSGVDNNTGKIQELNEAFEILGNIKKKQAYDAQNMVQFNQGLQKSKNPVMGKKFYFYEPQEEYYDFEQDEKKVKRLNHMKSLRHTIGQQKRKHRHLMMRISFNRKMFVKNNSQINFRSHDE